MSLRIYAGAAVAALSIAGAAIGLVNTAAAAPPPPDIAGDVRAEIDGRIVHFPSLKTDITADVQGDLANVTVVQTFVNPTTTPLNATYLFPLDKDAAVHAMQMQVGDEVVAARIEKKEAARQTFETAKRDGKAASLLEQQRPNMFTQNVANLMPGLPIVVTLKYVAAVPRIDGAYELRVPLVVGPRYMPQGRSDVVAAVENGVGSRPDAPAVPEAATPGQWSFGAPPAYPPVNGLTTPAQVEADRVGIKVNLAAGVPIPQVASATHAIAVTGDANARTRAVSLAGGRMIDNRDFVLRYTLAAGSIQAGLLAHRDATAGTLSLMLEPPQVPAEADVTPREIVFLLDTSGSMSGFPIQASKTFMQHALGALRATDYFRVIRFSNDATEMASVAVPATADNLRRGRAYVESLTADGGTEVITGLRKAFDMKPTAGARRILVFLSDGYVGNEAEILNMVAANVGETRTYVFGIGTAVNHYLLAEMAHLGHGFVRIVDPKEKTEDAAIAFARKLETTVMTDISIDWGGANVTEMTPAVIPDLFAGDSVRVQGRFTGAGPQTLKITGKINGRSATLPLVVELPAAPTGADTAAIPLIWARAQIADEMREMMLPRGLRRSGREDVAMIARVTELGLAYSLATQWTSFVAVSAKVVNDTPAAARDAHVPLPMVDGVGPKAYGLGDARNGAGGGIRHAAGPVVVPASGGGLQAAVPTFGGGFGGGGFAGGAAPEPEAVGGLAVVLLSLLAARRRRRRAAA